MTDLDFAEIIDRWDAVLDAIECGESFRIFRNGRPIAIFKRHLEPSAESAEPASPKAY
jgi:hypothetical protein